MFTKKIDREPQVRLHPSTLINPHMAALICQLVVITASKGVARITITEEILDRAEAMAMQEAPPAAQPIIEERFNAIRNVFEPIGLLDTGAGIWLGSGRLAFSGPGDIEAVEAALEYADDYIVTTDTRTLLHRLLAVLDIQVVTPGQMLLAAHQQVPDLMVEAMEAHRTDLSFSPELYEQYLHSARLDHLIPLMQTAT